MLSASAAAELVRGAARRCGRASVRRGVSLPPPSGNPLLLNELLKTLAADGVPPDAAHVDVVAELGPRAVSRAVLLRLARLSEDAVAGRPGGRGARRRSRADVRGGAGRARCRAPSPAPPASSSGRDPATRPAARLRAPTRPGRRLPGPRARRSASSITSAPPGCSRARVHPRSRSLHTCSRCRRAARPGRWTCCAPPPTRRWRRAHRTRPSRRCGGRSRSAAGGRVRHRAAARARPGAGADIAAGSRRRSPHCLRERPRADRPRARRREGLARALIFMEQAGRSGAHRGPSRRASSCRRSRPTSAAASKALEHLALFFGSRRHRERLGPATGAAHDRRRPRASARRCSPPSPRGSGRRAPARPRT